MNIESIENEELKEFAERAKNDNWIVNYSSGILYLSEHELHPNISISWESGNESWKLNKKEEGKTHIVSVGELSYPSSIFF